MLVCCTLPGRVTSSHASARGTLDFVNGTYNFDGSSFAAGAAITDTGQITGSGLEIGTSGNPNAPSIIQSDIQSFLDASQFTAVFRFTSTATAASHASILMALEEWFSGCNIVIQWWDDAEASDSNNFDGGRQAKDASNGSGVATHKIAVTRTNAKIRIAIDGHPIGADGSFENLTVTLPDPRDTASYDEGSTTAPFTKWNNYHLGGLLSDGFNGTGIPKTPVVIQSVTFYDPVEDVVLPSLSA